MTYTPTNWKPGVAGGTMVTAERLNKLEQGVVDAHAGNYLIGSGSPLGVISAPPGTRYEDTEKTLGASTWRKDSGTGNTGWVVVDGDTGWRTINGLFPEGDIVGGTVGLSRSRDTVTLRFSGTAFLNQVSATERKYPGLLPLGFRIDQSARFQVSASANVNGLLTSYNTGEVGLTPGTTGQMFNQISWKTSSAWPTTLPGTPG